MSDIDTINRIRNSRFTKGKRQPAHWQFETEGTGADWQTLPEPTNGDLAGVQVVARNGAMGALWSQKIRIRKGQNYRVEALITCDCTTDVEGGGVCLQLTLENDEGGILKQLTTPAVTRASVFTLRAYLPPIEGARTAKLQVGLHQARGEAVVHDVRVIPVIEPDAKSHPWALPPLPYANVPPRRCRRALVVTSHPGRPLVRMLTARLGENAVSVCERKAFSKKVGTADAVFLLDEKPPAGCRSMKALKALAEKRIVFVSPACMEQISGGEMAIRVIKQIDDPFHARVVHHNFATAAFSLYDIFPFFEHNEPSTRMRQPQFLTSKRFREYCTRHGFEVMLQSETDSDRTSEKPAALFRGTDHGAILAMDITPAETLPSTLEECLPAAQIVLSALGLSQSQVGHYVAPARGPVEFVQQIADFTDRFPALRFASGKRPRDLDQPFLVELGRDGDHWSSPLKPRPLILLRSGLAADDFLGAYGVMIWFKQMLRPAPFVCPYARDLLRSFRVAWIPYASRWPTWGGWSLDGPPAKGESGMYPFEASFDPGSIAALIDVGTSQGSAVRMTLDDGADDEAGISETLPRLFAAVHGDHHFAPAASNAAWGDRTARVWQAVSASLDITQARDPFGESIHAAVRGAGGLNLRLDTPGWHTDPATHSIPRTDAVAKLLELTCGLFNGAIIVNRERKALTVELPAVAAKLRDHAVIRAIGETNGGEAPSWTGQKVTIPSAHALIAHRT